MVYELIEEGDAQIKENKTGDKSCFDISNKK
jgi:hypothetical protein